jgi:hypothetical protein
MLSAYKRMLETPPAHHLKSKYKIAFLTGLSNPQSCTLSKIQKQFMAALELPEIYKLYLNFPYIPSGGEEREPPWKASLHNSLQFLTITSLRALIHTHLVHLANTTEHLILITGSCGLEILNAGLNDEVTKKILHVYALGPVAQQNPDDSIQYPCTLIQGSSDLISKLFFRNVAIQPSDVNHMNYLESKEVFEFINNHSQQLLTIFSSKSRQTV